MRNLRQLLCVAVGALIVTNAAGCSFFHEFKPHRLQRWNRGTGMDGGYEAYLSVSDPIPADAMQPVDDPNASAK